MLLKEFNATAEDYPGDRTIVDLFEEQAARTPEEVAVIFEERRLTYKEINERSNQLAHYLRGLGVREEMLVGISIERRVEMIIGILGILKAGGAYVPMDPAYPAERIGYMLEDTEARWVLGSELCRDRLPSMEQGVITGLDGHWKMIGLDDLVGDRPGVGGTGGGRAEGRISWRT